VIGPVSESLAPALEGDVLPIFGSVPGIVVKVDYHWRAIGRHRAAELFLIGHICGASPGWALDDAVVIDSAGTNEEALTGRDPPLRFGALDVDKSLEVVGVAVRYEDKVNVQRLVFAAFPVLIARRDMPREELVVAAIYEDDPCLIVIVRRSFEDDSVALLYVYHGESEHAFLMRAKWPSPDRSFQRAIEKLQGANSAGSVSRPFLQYVDLVPERQNRVLLAAP
jgi:hypothetical protein